jgi:hypothetical protein
VTSYGHDPMFRALPEQPPSRRSEQRVILLMREVLGNAALTSKDVAVLIPNLESTFRGAASPSPGG